MTGAHWPPRERAILHVDMDAFFAAVELRRRPELAGRPVVVGGPGPRGVVAAASYEARAFGIHSAMPSTRARRLCPEAVFLSGDHGLYREVSRRVMELFRDVTPVVEPVSLDEAFLDVTGARRLHGEPVAIARTIRERVAEAEGLPCSVGLAARKFVAKLASEQAKPRSSLTGPLYGTGITVVRPGEEIGFLHPLPVERLWGVGPATLARLHRLGVMKVGDLAELPLDTLVAALGPASGEQLHRLSHGVDDRKVEPHREIKSVGHERTFPRDLRSGLALEREVVWLADAVADRARRSRRTGRTVSLKVRFGDFSTITRSNTITSPTDSGLTIGREAKDLLRTVDPSRGVRLLGVTLSNLADGAARQLSLEEARSTWDDANRAIDGIRDRYGRRAIGPASLIGGSDDWTEERPWG